MEKEKEIERVVKVLRERLDTHDESRRNTQEKLHGICEAWRKQISEVEDKINNELEEKFTEEDSRLQSALNNILAEASAEDADKALETIRREKAQLLVGQKYELKIVDDEKIPDGLELAIKKEIYPEWLEFKEPPKIQASKFATGLVCVTLSSTDPEQEEVIAKSNLKNVITYKFLLQKKDILDEAKEYTSTKEDGSFTFAPDFIEAEATYVVKVKAMSQGKESEWSKGAEFVTPEFSSCCAWKECPDYVNLDKKYVITGTNLRIATNVNNGCDWGDCTIIGNTPLPHNKVTSWGIKILGSNNILIGVTPFDINQNAYNNFSNHGWYFSCSELTLYSGPPHNYWNKEYIPKDAKSKKQHTDTGDSVGVVMDTAKGELSFVVNGVNLGVAFDGIPLDKPLVPCVLFIYPGGSVELII